MLWTDLRILLVDTGRLWWRLLPQLLTIYLLGWLASRALLTLAVIAGDVSAWLTLIIFAFSFLSKLVAVVLILRLCGRELGIRDMIPDDEGVQDDRDNSVTQLLAVTLLPFLGIYAAFGEVSKAAGELYAQQFARYGVFSDNQGVTGLLYIDSWRGGLRLAAIVIGVYVLRRVVDYLHERTGRRILGLLVALIESFFMLVVIMGGIRVVQLIRIWLRERAFAGWISAVKDRAAELLSVFKIDLPAVLVQLTRFFSEQVWPVFWDVLSQPIIWLAVAALIYGSQVLSVADLWRKGQPLAQKVPGASKFARHSDKVALRRVGPPPEGLRKVAAEAREAFLGDIDDKYLPTFHSIRLILRAGAVFLGSFVLVYALQTIVTNYFSLLVDRLLGGHDVDFYITNGPWLDLLTTLPFEPLRLCLLAVAFRRCLELFRQHATSVGAAPEPARPTPVEVSA